MKRAEYTTSFVHAFLALALTGMLSACVGRSLDPIDRNGGNGSLTVRGTVSEGTLVTKAEAVEGLKEKQLNSLDVFVEKATKNEDGSFTGSGSIMKQYHLVASTAVTIQEAAQNWLADYWKDEGLEVGQYYNIYVAANNPKTTNDVADVEALKALTYSEVEAGIAVVQENDNNIGWKDGKTSGNVYKLYDTNPGDARALTSEKEFMMDGVIEGWTPDEQSRDQVFDVTLNRAAAKFVLNVKFKAEFLASLAAEGVSITGSPAWKFYNFAFGAPVFAPETQGEGVEVHNSGFNIFHNQPYTDSDKHFTITTYSYPNQWDAANYATDAPSLVISVGYTEGEGAAAVTNYHYYRIPLVKSTTTAIERNHIYVINATIATRGSATQEDVTETEDVEYAVLPWNDETNSAAIHNEVEAVQHYYLNVNPKVYTLRGDGDQSVIINYTKASGTAVNWKLFAYDEEGDQTAVVAKNDPDAIRAWFYNASGAFTTSYNDNEQNVNWNNSGPTPMGVRIEQSTEGVNNSSGTVTVTSHALNNRAIKYIRLRVFLDAEETFQEGKETMYEDIIIRHFPTDNIQSIVGSWSSYIPASGGTQTITLTTRDKAEADEWATTYGKSYTTNEINATDYISYAEYTPHAGETGYTMTGPTPVNQNAFQAAVQDNTDRRNANSQANAIPDGGEGHAYYWGTNPQQVDWWDDPDYYTGSFWGGTRYRYQYYYSASYSHAYTYTEYSMTVEIPTTGNWVDWERDAGQTYDQANVKYTRGEIFTAKVFNNNRVYAIQPTRSGSQGNRRYTYQAATSQTNYETYQEGGNWSNNNSSMANLTNNHMYVIQISSTSEGYIMGRPILGNPNANLSQDDVVSPAFMIASQLGAVTPTNNNQTAAAHCRRYMEVATDGTRYTGWRLPTPDEISVITRYQQGTINGVTISNASYQAMTPVLTGGTYWSLTGNPVSTGIGDDGPYLRCVRDLTAAEVEALNGFEAIQEKYGKKTNN